MCLLVECPCHIPQKEQVVSSHVPASPLLNESSFSLTPPPLAQSALPDINENKYLTEGFVAKMNEDFIVHKTSLSKYTSHFHVSIPQMFIVLKHLFFLLTPFQLLCLLVSPFPSHPSPWAVISLILLLDSPPRLSVSLFPYVEYFNSATAQSYSLSIYASVGGCLQRDDLCSPKKCPSTC